MCLSRTTRININDSDGSGEYVDQNCTRLDNGTLVCPCNVEWNNTYYPCWMEIEDPIPTTTPTPLPPTCQDCPSGSYANQSSGILCTRKKKD